MFADAFSIYGTGGVGNSRMLLGPPWLEANASGPSTANPRPHGTHCYLLSATTGGNPGYRCGFDANWTTFKLRNAVRLSALPSGNDKFYIFQPRTAGNAAQCSVLIGASGQIIVTSGGESGTVLGTSDNGVISAGQIHVCEAKFVINGATGSVEVRVDEITTAINLSNVNTAAGGGTTAASNAARIVGGEVFTCGVYDYSQNEASELPGDPWLGDTQVLLQLPSAATAQNDFSVTGAANAAAATSGNPPAGDAAYIEGSTAGQVTEMQYPDLPANVSLVIATIMRPCWKKPTAGTSTLKVGLHTQNGAGGIVAGPTQAMPTDYAYDYAALVLNPDTGVQFTPAEWNASRVRFEKVA